MIVFAVPHTHWDREWYFSKATFQMMNVDMMDRLLHILRTQPDYTAFLLDGQMIALEDYLAVCPDRRAEIASHVKTGRLAIGPWYVLPDEYLASGEAHIRNFMEGMRVADGLGGGERIGYLPDSFGHPAQIPQIIRGLGMEEMVFWRGPGPDIGRAEFRWQSPDGSTVLALNMVHGYSNAACLPTDRAARTKRLDHEIGKLKALSVLNLVLLMNGSDHIAPDPHLPQWLAEYREDRPGIDIRQAQMTDYVREAHRRAAVTPLQTVPGELRSGYRAYLLGDTLSTRMPLKQKQRAVEALVESGLEPALAMLARERRLAYPAQKLRYLWKKLLQNLPHDSICGCGIDPVHDEMRVRYRQIDDLGAHLSSHIAQALSPDTAADEGAYDGAVTVFNHQPFPVQTPVQVALRQTLYPLRYVDYEQDQVLLELTGDDGVPLPTGIDFIGSDGTFYPGQLHGCALTDTVDSSLDRQPTMNRCLAMDATFVPPLPSLGYAQFGYRLRYDAPPLENAALENAYYRVQATPEGTLDVFCKESGRWLRGLNQLADTADTGDEYTLDTLPGDRAITLSPDRTTVTRTPHALVIEGVLTVPLSATRDRKGRTEATVDCPVRMAVTLLPGVPRIDIVTEIENLAKDHCIAARFPLGETAAQCFSDSLCCIEAHPLVWNASPEAYAGWKELPNNTFFQKNFACLLGETQGLAVYVRGLPQLAVSRQAGTDALSLTLLRCVGWLSRPDLRSRDGNGGWTVETPGAQELGKHAFAYAIRPFAPDKPLAGLYREAEGFAAAPFALQTAPAGAHAALAHASFASVESEAVFCSAFKQAESGEGYVLRLHNMTADPVRTVARFPGFAGMSLAYASLDERVAGAVPTEEAGGCMAATLSFRPWQIVTLLIRPAIA